MGTTHLGPSGREAPSRLLRATSVAWTSGLALWRCHNPRGRRAPTVDCRSARACTSSERPPPRCRSGWYGAARQGVPIRPPSYAHKRPTQASARRAPCTNARPRTKPIRASAGQNARRHGVAAPALRPIPSGARAHARQRYLSARTRAGGRLAAAAGSSERTTRAIGRRRRTPIDAGAATVAKHKPGESRRESRSSRAAPRPGTL